MKKDFQLWRKTWQDLRSKGKLKAQLTRERGTTGGGPPPTVNLDEKLDALISEIEACGDSQTKESSVTFDFMERIQTNGYSLKLPVEDPLHIRNDKPIEENSNESNIQLEKGKTPTTSRTNTPKKKFSITARQLNKSIAETQKLVNVAEKTCALQKWYYEEKVEIYKKLNEKVERIAPCLKKETPKSPSPQSSKANVHPENLDETFEVEYLEEEYQQ